MTSSYLGRIIGRAREELDVVEPVLGSRYEEGPEGPGLEEVETFVEALGRRRTPPRPVDAEPAPAVPESRDQPPPADRQTMAAPMRSIREEVTRRVAVPAPDAVPPRTVTELPGSPSAPAVHHTEPFSVEPTPEQEVTPAPPGALEPEVVERVAEVAGRERMQVELLEWERVVERMAPPARERPASVITRRVAEVRERPPELGREEHETSATPGVHVHIGRIEIVAPPEAGPPVPPRRARFEPELSLAAYLEERRKPRN